MILLLLCARAYGSGNVSVVGELLIETGKKLGGVEVGGLSGLFYDPKDKSLYAIQDGPSPGQTRPHIFVFSTFWDRAKLEIKFKKTITLENLAAPHLWSDYDDLESIVKLPSGDFILSSEGSKQKSTAALLRFSSVGKFKGLAFAPFDFLPKENRGVMHNRSLESLSVKPMGEVLFTANEMPLVQEKSGGAVRVVQFLWEEKKQMSFRATYFYPLDAIPGNGVVDITTIYDYKLLVMERAYDSQTDRPSIRIYQTLLRKYLKDGKLSSVLVGQKLPKNLILNLDQLKPKLSKRLSNLDNFEGLTLGPNPSWHRGERGKTIIMVSDNNFKKTQINAFVVVYIKDL